MRRVTEHNTGLADSVLKAITALEAGFLAVIPTDTVYGLAADPRRADARDKLYAAKGRDRGKPIPILVSGAEQAVRMGAVFSAAAQKLADRYWPGPLTLVLPARNGFEGFRVPDHPVALAIIAGVGGALYATSANRSGEKPAATAVDAASALAPFVGAWTDDGPAPGGTESTVVRIEGDSVQILREGAVSSREIEACVRA